MAHLSIEPWDTFIGIQRVCEGRFPVRCDCRLDLG